MRYEARSAGSSYRAGSFIIQPVFLGIVLAGVAVWLGLSFAFGSSQSAAGIVAAVALFVLGVALVTLVLLFVFFDAAFTLVEAAGSYRR